MFFEMRTVAHRNVCSGETEVVAVRTPLRHSPLLTTTNYWPGRQMVTGGRDQGGGQPSRTASSRSRDCTPLRHSRLYFVLYKTLCFLVFRTAGPLAALIVLNARLICALYVTPNP